MAMGTADPEGEGKHRRERVRKPTAAMGGKRKQDLVKKKARVRSEKSLEKRNMKK
jgi:nucleolar protein 12